jgi:copper homeostasis protein
MANILLEVCVDDFNGLKAACEGGADRIELCSALSIGGLTPSAGLMEIAGELKIPTYAMIRPRDGDFVYNPAELDIMKRDIDKARKAGLDGVVIGANLADGTLDRTTLVKLINHSKGLGITLHRAFDLVPDIWEAVDLAVELGFERILTSGRAKTATEGLGDIRAAIEVAATRISIMPGSGVTLQTVDAILAETQVTEIHSSCSAIMPVANPKVTELGFAPANPRKTDAETVRALKAHLAARP